MVPRLGLPMSILIDGSWLKEGYCIIGLRGDDAIPGVWPMPLGKSEDYYSMLMLDIRLGGLSFC